MWCLMARHPFEYHKPDEDQTSRMKQINEYVKDAYETILGNVPESAERTIAIRKLQEARMWANAAIVINE
jgi:hypothetical protein